MHEQKNKLPWLCGLNKSQKEAVSYLNGPLLVLSGAGTGKTKVLTSRIAQLIATNTAEPYKILAVTFTNKAAREMKERISELIGPIAEQITIGTFHSIAAKILRTHAGLINLSRNFLIIDDDDQVRLLKDIMENEKIDVKVWNPRSIASKIKSWKDQAISYKNAKNENYYNENVDIVKIYKIYQERLTQINACDFGDLLLHFYNILNSNNDILEIYQSKFKWILVDEYQDTNIVQYLLLRLLAKKYENLCCVGDDDQSIYAWRGAEVGNILQFENNFSDCKIVKLEENYRSTGSILKAASHLINNNINRLGKTLYTSSPFGNGENIALINSASGKDEAQFVSFQIEEFLKDNFLLDQMAILVRTTAQTREFEERFNKINLPYKIVGTKFYNRQEIKDAVAYLRIVQNTSDDISFERIVNVPKRGIGATTLNQIKIKSREIRGSYFEATLELVSSNNLKPNVKIALLDFTEKIKYWRGMKDSVDLIQLLDDVLVNSKYREMLESDNDPRSPERIQNLNELMSATKDHENLNSFLENIALNEENNEDNMIGAITIMTLHAAKGLEFDIVYLCGWEEGIFPSKRSIDENGQKGLEEERRLAYVGITRAKKRLFISFASTRRIYGFWQDSIPSRFIDELPTENLEKINTNNYFLSNQYFENEDENFINKINRIDYSNVNNSDVIEEYNFNKNKTMNYNQINFEIGDKVEHKKFGCGEIVEIGDNDYLIINFENDDFSKRNVGKKYVSKSK